MQSIAIFFVCLVAMVQVAYGASAGERALSWTESQRDAALVSVAIAQNRVEAAESDLTVSRNVERDISNSKDKAAQSIAREAVTVSEQGVIEAKTLLKRATAFLSKQEATIAEVKKFIAGNNSHKALVIPVEGKFRIASSSGIAFDSKKIIGSLRKGDRIEVGQASSARVFVSGGNAEIALSENSSLTLDRNQADDSFEGLLNEGFARIRVALQGKYAHKFEVRTGQGTASIRGTDFSVQAMPNKTRIEVFESTVYFSPIQGGAGVEIHAGEGCDVLKDGGIQPVTPLENNPRKSPWSDRVTPD